MLYFCKEVWELSLPSPYSSKRIMVSIHPKREITLIISFSSCCTNLISSFTILVARLILLIKRITSLQLYITIL